MPVLPTITDVWRVTLNWGTAHGFTPRNVLHFRAPGLTDADIVTSLEANFTDEMWAPIQQDWAFTSLDLLKLDGTSATRTDAISAQGSLSSGDWIVGTAAVVSARTAQRGSRGRGRVFLGPLAESQLTAGLISGITPKVAAWEAFRTAMEGDGIPWVIASYVHADAHPVSNVHMPLIPGQLRRRNDQLR